MADPTKFVAYCYGVNPWTGKTTRETFHCDDLTAIVGRIVSSFEGDCEIILNGHDLSLEEIRRWALITEGRQE